MTHSSSLQCMSQPISLQNVYENPSDMSFTEFSSHKMTYFFLAPHIKLNETKENELLWLFLGLFKHEPVTCLAMSYSIWYKREKESKISCCVNMPQSLVVKAIIIFHTCVTGRWQHNHIMYDKLFFMSSLCSRKLKCN